MSMPAAIYARVSSDRQREQETIASQTAALKTYADEQGYVVPPEWVEIPVPALISEETFALAQAQLAQNTRFARRRTKRPTLLQGLLVCAQCGYAVCRRRGVYRCWGREGHEHPNGPVCTAPVTRQDHLDALVWREVIRLLEDSTLVEAELARRRAAARQTDPTRQRIDDLTRQQVRLATAMDRWSRRTNRSW